MKLSVFLVTYNQEHYIRQALDSILMQQVNFDYEIIIGEDCSTDATAAICDEYAAQYPNIYVYHHNPNKGLIGNWEFVLNHCHGEYIAMLEGDDFWTDPLKLQKQVDVLESDPQLMAVVTDTCVVDREGNVITPKLGNTVPGNKEGKYTIHDFFAMPQHHYTTATVMYSTRHYVDVNKKLLYTISPYLGDWQLWIILHSYGAFYYLNEVTAAYRTNPTSLTHTVNRVARAKASRDICRKVADILPEEYSDIAADLRKTNWVWISLIFAYKAEKRYFGMLGSFIMAAILCPKSLWQTIKGALTKRKNK